MRQTSARAEPGKGPRVLIFRACALGVLLLVSLSLGLREASARDHTRDLKFATYLINELKYFDVAERFLEEIKSNATDRRSQCDVAYLHVDILKKKGKTEEYLKALERVKKQCPDHQRSSLNSLEKINIEMNKVNKIFELASATGNAEEASALRKQGQELFRSEVERPLDLFIEEAQKETADLAKKGGPTYGQARLHRNLSESIRVRLMLNFAKLLPEGEVFEADRHKYLKTGLKLATEFVEDRSEFYRLQYDVQLMKGRFELELEDYSAAYDDLSLIVDLGPRGPVGSEQIQYFKKLHLESVLFAARAANHAGMFSEAARLVNRRMLTAQKGPLDLSRADKDPSLEQFYVLAKLERAIGLSGSGQAEAGLRLIQEVIKKYSGSANGELRVTDARKALGTMAALGNVPLRGIDYFQGAMGLYSEHKFDQALVLFQEGLGAPRSSKELKKIAPLCLNKIGEINYLKKHYVEAAIAYLEICRHYGSHKLAAKAARNALAATDKLRRKNRQHKGYTELDDLAKSFYDKLGGSSIAIFQKTMAEAHEAQQQRDYDKAVELYQKIPADFSVDKKKGRKKRSGKKTKNGKREKIPFYWTAQARIRICRYQLWKATDAASRKIDDALVLAKELTDIQKNAAAAGRQDSAVEASFSAGQIYLEAESWSEAVTSYKPFLESYKNDQVFRAVGLYNLIQAAFKIEDGEVATRAFAVLEVDFPEHDATFLSTLPMLDFALQQEGEEAGKDAARYAKIYTDHPTGQEELKNDPDRRMAIIDILLEGGDFESADVLLKQTEKEAKRNPNLRKRLLLRKAISGFNQKQFETVIQALNEYIGKFNPDGGGQDDAQVYRYLGESHAQIYIKSESIDEVKKSVRHYGRAMGLILPYVDSDQSGKAKSDYWRWALRWCKLQRILGRAGDIEGWKSIRKFVGLRERTELGGKSKKKQFLAIKEEAERAVEKALR